MDEFKLQSSENLLGKIWIMKNVSESEIEASKDRLSKPLTDVVYAKSGTIEMQAGACTIKVEYDSVKPDANLLTPQVEQRIGTKEWDDNWRRVKSLVFSINGREIDIQEIISSSEIFFMPSNTEHLGYGFAMSKLGKAFAYGDITKPIVLGVLLHELGHVVDTAKLKELGLAIAVDEHKFSNEAEVLRQERTASAFAFKLMRPFMDVPQRKDMLNFLKYYALKTYYDDAQYAVTAEEAAKRRLEKDLLHYLHEYETDMQSLEDYNVWEDFLEWKKTDAYKEWKQKEEYRDIEEHDEFGAWRKWLEDTNHDYSKDFKDEN